MTGLHYQPSPMKKNLLLILAVFGLQICYGQTDFRTGFVVTQSQDTLLGLIDYHDGFFAHKSCAFKKSKTEEAITYTPLDITGYGFTGGKYFESRPLAGANIWNAAFFEVIIRGMASLYRHGNTFYATKESELHPLTNMSSEVYVNNRKLNKQTNQHIVVLNTLLFDCVEIRDDIQKVKDTERSFTELIEKYNRCKGQLSVTYKNNLPWITVTLSPWAGVNMPDLHFERYPSGYNHLNADFKSSLSPTAGASLALSSPRISDRMSFVIDIAYMQNTYRSSDVIVKPLTTETNQITIDLKSIKVPVGIRFRLPQRQITPYLGAGVSRLFHVDSRAELDMEIERNGTKTTESEKALPSQERSVRPLGRRGHGDSYDERLRRIYRSPPRKIQQSHRRRDCFKKHE